MNTQENPSRNDLGVNDFSFFFNDSNSNFKLLISVLNSIKEFVTITDLSGIILYVNKAFLTAFGYEESEIIGKSIDIVNPSPTNFEIREITKNGTWHGTVRNIKKDGSEFVISLNTYPIKDEKGNTFALLGISSDLTDQIAAEQKLQDVENKFQSLFEDLEDVVYESTPDGKFVDLNPAGMDFFGISNNEELQRINIAKEMYLHGNEREKFKEELEKYGFVKDYQLDIRKLSGEVATVLETSYAVKNDEGKIIAYRGILRDITEEKRNETRLRQLLVRFEFINDQLKKSQDELINLNQAKDRLFSIIAHDLRSPFSALLSFSEFLADDIDNMERDEIKSFSEKIHESAKNVFTLLENLLQWSRIQSGKIPYQPSKFNMNSKIEQVINLLRNNAENKKIIITNNAESTSFVFADEDMIFSVIQNLLSNAIKFTREGGSITFNSLLNNEHWKFSVTDNGVGISEEDLEKLFRVDSHHTTYGTNEEKGSGLGLVICKEMIERNKGKIWVKSKKGEGTSFHFTLPKVN
ncbi:MAG: PAS domain-containing sensor histidine kinase [Ignavibacteriales bacterium]|nr:PAS domain-containing sensor histidine kinase [Ignavibacteriales bacterium]